MKKTIGLVVLVLIITQNRINAQSNLTEKQKNDSSQRAQIVFGEIGGNGLLLSANYDFRFFKSQKGLGMRVGLGFFGGSGGGIVTVPVGLNFLAGKAPNYLEVGAGYTYATFTGGSDSFFSGSGGVFVPSIGYRYQPIDKGFVALIFVSPLVSLGTGGGWIFWGGIGIGVKI